MKNNVIHIKILNKIKKTRCSRIKTMSSCKGTNKYQNTQTFLRKILNIYFSFPNGFCCAKQIIIYNLRGRKVETPQAGGLYMKNGKKNIHRPYLKQYALGTGDKGTANFEVYPHQYLSL
jgi:hypothetical protein